MYPNPFDRKHSTIRQLIDKIIFPDSNGKRKKDSTKTFNNNTSPNEWRKKQTPMIIQAK